MLMLRRVQMDERSVENVLNTRYSTNTTRRYRIDEQRELGLDDRLNTIVCYNRIIDLQNTGKQKYLSICFLGRKCKADTI